MARPKTPRAKPSRTTVRQVAEFYEGDPSARLRYVVTDKDDEVHLHHLDEQPSHSDSEFNLIPLNGALNGNIDKRAVRIPDERLSREGLSNRAAFYFSRGKYAYGYGCSVLGASLAFNAPWNASGHSKDYFKNADTAAAFCANALVNLRPLNSLNYATYLLRRILYPLIKSAGHEIERFTCARVAMEIGSYYRDAAQYKRANKLVALARHSIRGERGSTRVRTLLARLWQHEGIASIGEGNLRLAQRCFKKAAEETTLDYSTGQANETLYGTNVLLQSDRPDFDRIRQMLAAYPANADPRILTKWTDIELRMTEAQVAYQRNDAHAKKRSFELVQLILGRIVRERVIPVRSTFAACLLAFARENEKNAIEVGRLIRTLPLEFVEVATSIERRLRYLVDK
jgi:hypothetical protein